MNAEKYRHIYGILTEAEGHLKEAEKLSRPFTAEIRAFHRQKALKQIGDAKLLLWARGFVEHYRESETADAIGEAIALLRASKDLDVRHNERSYVLQQAGLARALALLEGLRQSDGGGQDNE